MFYRLSPYSREIKKRFQIHKKLYVVDNVIVALFSSDVQRGKLLEDTVYIELLRRKKSRIAMDFGLMDSRLILVLAEADFRRKATL